MSRFFQNIMGLLQNTVFQGLLQKCQIREARRETRRLDMRVRRRRLSDGRRRRWHFCNSPIILTLLWTVVSNACGPAQAAMLGRLPQGSYPTLGHRLVDLAQKSNGQFIFNGKVETRALQDSALRNNLVLQINEGLQSLFDLNTDPQDVPFFFEMENLRFRILNLRVLSLSYRMPSFRFEIVLYAEDGTRLSEPLVITMDPHSILGTVIDNSRIYLASSFQGRGFGARLIYQELDFLNRMHPGAGQVKLSAIDVGRYAWAISGLDFTYPEDLNSQRLWFRDFARTRGILLSPEDLQWFTKPYHFAAFDDGRGHHWLTSDLQGKPIRHTGTLGQLFLLRSNSPPAALQIRTTDFFGQEPQRFVLARRVSREASLAALSPEYQAVVAEVRTSIRQHCANLLGE